MNRKAMVIRDDIYGDLVVPKELCSVVAHPLFQRLRGIGQTGLLRLVYPGMTHSRFEHSLGTMLLAEKWLNHLEKVHAQDEVRKKFFPLRGRDECSDGHTIDADATVEAWGEITSSSSWRRAFLCAALLHDVGHGPFSHSIEQYGVFSFDGAKAFISDKHVRDFVTKRAAEHDGEISKGPGKWDHKKIISHEDFSVVIIHKILLDAGVFGSSREFPLYVCAMVSKEFRKSLIKSGTVRDQHKLQLLSVMISGLFDVDRLDYTRRDTTKAGVNFGRFEVDRLISSLIPALVTTPKSTDPEVNLVTRARNIHSMDHFLVGLFQLFTTLYMHPSYEGYQHELGLLVETAKQAGGLDKLTLKGYEHATDAWLAGTLNQLGDGKLYNRLIAREFKSERSCFQTYSKASLSSSRDENLKLIGGNEREIIKDGVKVWLIDQLPSGKFVTFPWDDYSLVARNLRSVRHTPVIWWKNPNLVKELKKVLAAHKSASGNKGKRRAF